ERPGDLVLLDHAHGHLGHRDRLESGRADVVAVQRDQSGVDHDALAAADDGAAFDHAHAHVRREGDVDPLGVAPGRGDRAVANRHATAPDVDPVERRPDHVHAVEEDVAGLLDVDAVLAADDGDVADGDVTRVDHDPSPDDGAPLADEVLAPVDHE